MGKLKEHISGSIDPNRIVTRDDLVVRLINGATKSGIHVDRKKKQNKEKCRKASSLEED